MGAETLRSVSAMDLEETRQPNKYHTYEKHRKFLVGELEEKTDKWYTVRKDVKEVLLPSLSKRIQHLIDDIVLLDSAGYLDSKYWDGGWDAILNVQPRLGFDQETDLDDPPLWIPNTRIEDEVNLGYSIGRILRLICSGLGSNVDHNALGWGFILGFLGEPRSRFDVEKSRVLGFLVYVKNKMGSKERVASSIPNTMRREAIEEESTRPNELKAKQSWNISEIGKEGRAAYKEGSTGSLPSQISLIQKIFKGSPEKPNELVKLAEDIQFDANLLEDSHHKGLEATDAFRVLWENKSGATRETIKNECEVYPDLVSKIMNDIGDNPSASKWEDRPLLVKDISSSDTGRKWRVTDYGHLVGICLYEENGHEQLLRAITQEMTREYARSDFSELIHGGLEFLQTADE